MIKKMEYDDILDIRKKVLWPKRDHDFVKMPFDESEHILHIGLTDDLDIINVVSLDFKHNSMQICQLATVHKFQGKGYGKKLMKHIFNIAENRNIQKIWCNSRKEKCGFYSKYGLNKTGETYIRYGREIFQMELNL